MHDLTRERMRPAEDPINRRQITGGKRDAHARARVRALRVATQGRGVRGEAQLLTERQQSAQVPRALMAEAEVLTHDDDLGAQGLHQKLARELPRIEARELERERLDHDS